MPRNATEPGGMPKFGYSALGSTIFWWAYPKLSNILCVERPPFPNAQMGKAGVCETTDQTKGRRGTPRGATERYGT